MAKGQLYKTAQEQLNAYVRAHALRDSQVRNTVLELMCSLRQPFTEAQLQEVCVEKQISRATVYNTLNMCLKAKLIRAYERSFGQKVREYELITSPLRTRMQICCRKCGRKAFFADKALMRMVEERAYINFEVQRFTLVVYGECKACKRIAARKAQSGKA